MDLSSVWVSPQHELNIGGEFLLEAGELFSTTRTRQNDSLMRQILLLVPARRIENRRVLNCLGCGKRFVNRDYLLLHTLNGCGRTKAQRVYVDQLEEDAATYEDRVRLEIVAAGARYSR